MSNLPVLLDTLVHNVHERIQSQSPFIWVRDEPTEEDLDHIVKESADSDRFDKLRLKSTMMTDLKQGKAVLQCRRGPYAKVLVVTYPEVSLPWALWARIFQAFGPPPAPNKLWRIVWFANLTKREFPSNPSAPLTPIVGNHGAKEIGPQHVNGGYTQACNPSAVVIYRYEEGSRVLLHELLHAACLDNMNDEEPVREALTETWAELFLIAVQAGGNKKKAQRLWAIQSQWIADQAAVLEGEYGVSTPMDYAWRYTVGRREILNRFHISLPAPSCYPKEALQNSLAFTAPALNTLA